MKYAIFTVMDQTIVYLDSNGKITTKCNEAKLFDSAFEASRTCVSMSVCSAMKAVAEVAKGGAVTEEQMAAGLYYLEGIEDESEFSSREDTW